MTEAARVWVAMAALGAGLLHVAVGASAVGYLLAPLVLIGAAEFSWALVALARDHVPAPRWATYLPLVPVFGWSVLATAGSTFELPVSATALPLFPMLTASALDMFIALLLAFSSRRRARARGTNPAGPAHAGSWRFVAALAVAASVVSLVTVPALSVTKAGTAAVVVHELHGGHH